MPSLPKTFTRPERTFSRTKDLANHALTLTSKALRHTLTLLVPRYLPEEADTVWAKNHLGTQSLSCRYTQEEEAGSSYDHERKLFLMASASKLAKTFWAFLLLKLLLFRFKQINSHVSIFVLKEYWHLSKKNV